MMAELGGPRPREGIEEKVRSDVQDVASGTAWIKIIVPSKDTPDVVAGTVSLWSHNVDGELLSEIGWMVLPEFQGHGLANRSASGSSKNVRSSSPAWSCERTTGSSTPAPI